MADLYKILGVDRSSTPDHIKRAFRRMSKKLHPDVGGNAEEFQKVEQAYRILSDPEERAYYDHHGSARPKIVENNPNIELYKMLTEIMMGVVVGIKNPSTEDLVGLMKKKMHEGIPALEENIGDAAKMAIKIESAMKRIKSRTPENVLVALMRSQLDGLEMQVARGKLMIETLKKGILFMDDYQYEITLMIASSDLAEALRRQDSGLYDQFFKLRT